MAQFVKFTYIHEAQFVKFTYLAHSVKSMYIAHFFKFTRSVFVIYPNHSEYLPVNNQKNPLTEHVAERLHNSVQQSVNKCFQRLR